MNDIVFLEPVILQIPGLGLRKVATSFEALECLAYEWPEWARERSWRYAQSICRDALDGWRDVKSARRSFVKAARRAGLLPARPRQSGPVWAPTPSSHAAFAAGAQ